MTPSPDQNEKLERLISRTLRELPPRRAPHSLELRVLAELERRVALPWWQQSFVHWPVAARGAFILLSAGVVRVVLMAVVWTMVDFDTAQFTAAFGPHFAWLQSGIDLVAALVNTGSTIFHSVPPLWLYGTATVLAAMYAALFGIGAAAYRTLHSSR